MSSVKSGRASGSPPVKCACNMPSLPDCWKTLVHCSVDNSDSVPANCSGFEQYTQCSGQRCVSSAIRARGLGTIGGQVQRSVVDDPFLLQLLEKLRDVVANLFRVRFIKLCLQFGNDFAEGALPVAALEHLASGALQLDGAFGKKNHAVLFGSSPAATGGQPRLAGILRGSHQASTLSMRNAPGGGQPGCT